MCTAHSLYKQNNKMLNGKFILIFKPFETECFNCLNLRAVCKKEINKTLSINLQLSALKKYFIHYYPQRYCESILLLVARNCRMKQVHQTFW